MHKKFPDHNKLSNTTSFSLKHDEMYAFQLTYLTHSNWSTFISNKEW